MTNLATKNGSLIVKDGKLAEDCVCCGEWYCCFSPACVADSLSSVSVAISAQDYLIWQHGYTSGSSGITNTYLSYGFLGSLYNGTHSLTKQSDGNTWKKTFQPTPHSTCLGDLSLVTSSTGWSLVFRYSILAYGDFSNSVYKTLSQMECRGFPDPAAGYPNSSGPQGSQSLLGNIGACAELLNISQQLTFQAVFPYPAYSGLGGFRETVKEEGSYMVSLGMSVS